MKFYLFILLLGFSRLLISQCTGWNNLQLLTDTFPNPAFGNYITIEKDKMSRPFVYIAAKNGGFKVYNISAIGTPSLVTTLPVASFGGNDVINLSQNGNYIYATLGDIWGGSQPAGIAIIDVTNISTINVTDYYTHPGSTLGAGAVVVKSNMAYLAANGAGLLILDVSNKYNIVFKSQLLFSNIFPHSPQGASSTYNARGIDIKDTLAYVCYDKGGLRVVNVKNPLAPVQISQYCFSNLINFSTAYNNIVIYNDMAFVSIDYYGVEILNISNPLNLTQISWWHPSSWPSPTNNFSTWSSSPGHANELAFDTICKIIYVAAGKSDVVAIDLKDSLIPVSCQTYGSTMDAYGTWGLDYFQGKVYASYIWSVAAPPYSNYTGFVELQTNSCNLTAVNEMDYFNVFKCYPNPAKNDVIIENASNLSYKIELINSIGNVILKSDVKSNEYKYRLPLSSLSDGLYFINFHTEKGVYTKKLVVKLP
jgi:hypothetical protein